MNGGFQCYGLIAIAFAICLAPGANNNSDPYTCNSGQDMEPGKTCDWKSWGFFGTMGEGLRVIIKDKFLDHPGVHEIFMPVGMEETAQP